MVRPFLVFGTFLVLILGGAAGADAADFLTPILVQIPKMSRGPGFYLNLYKFVPVVLIYLLWTWTTDWVEHDTKELNNVKFELWNSVIFFTGVLGLALMFAIPIYPLSLSLLLLAYLVPILTSSYVPNHTLPAAHKPLTPSPLRHTAHVLSSSLPIHPPLP